MAEEYDEIEDALGLPPEDESDPEQETDQPADESEQDTPVSEAKSDAGDAGTGEEGSDTGETDSEAPAPAEPTEMQRLLAEMADLKKANSGLYAEMHSERERRRQLMEKYSKDAEAEQAAKKKAEAEAGLPDKDEDPVGYMEARERQLFESVEQRLERMEQARQQEQQQQVFQQAVATVNADEERFRKEKGDYDDALNFARNERSRLLRATHPDQPDEWVNQQIANGDRMFALQSLQQGISPANRAYDYAVRLGYTPGAGNGGQAAPAAAPAPAQPAKPAEKPKQTSLSGVQGKAGGRGRKLTMDEAVRLPDGEFDKIMYDPVKAAELSEHGYTFW